MIINFVLPSMGFSGGIDVVYKYVELLTHQGHDVRVYKELKASNMHRYNSKLVNSCHQIYCTFKACVQKNREKHAEDCFVWKLMDDSIRDADVIIATSWPTAYRVNGLSPSKGKKYYFVQGYEIWDNEEMGKNSYKLPLNKIVISTWINEQLKTNMEIGPFPVVYNGIDSKQFRPYEVEHNCISILMLNHTLPKKGVKQGLEVFDRIQKKYPECKFRMFGMCDGSELPPYVEYYQDPSKDTLVKLYSKSDIFLFPSLEEGWGLTPLEAMACGCAVVGSRTGFVLDLGMHEKNMLICKPGDVDEMTQSVERLIKDNKLLMGLKEAGSHLTRDLNWDKSCRKLTSLLKEGQKQIS